MLKSRVNTTKTVHFEVFLGVFFLVSDGFVTAFFEATDFFEGVFLTGFAVLEGVFLATAGFLTVFDGVFLEAGFFAPGFFLDGVPAALAFFTAFLTANEPIEFLLALAFSFDFAVTVFLAGFFSARRLAGFFFSGFGSSPSL